MAVDDRERRQLKAMKECEEEATRRRAGQEDSRRRGWWVD